MPILSPEGFAAVIRNPPKKFSINMLRNTLNIGASNGFIFTTTGVDFTPQRDTE